jgi:hypothetical protein
MRFRSKTTAFAETGFTNYLGNYDHMNFNSSIDVTYWQHFDTRNVKRGILTTRFPNCIVFVHLNLTIK